MKKMWKKVSAVLLAFAMCIMTLPLTAAAANGDYKMTFEPHAGHTYKVYQLLKGDVSVDGTKLSNAVLGDNALQIKNDAPVTAEQIMAAINNQAGEIAQGKEALNWVDTTTDVKATITTASPNLTITVPAGYYVVTDEYTDENAQHATTLSVTVLKLVGDVTVEPKDDDVPDKPGKTVQKPDPDNPDNLVPADAVSIGDVLTYTLSGTIPQMEHYTEYTYQLVDTMSKGLVTEVKVGDTREVTLKKEGKPDKGATFKVISKNTDAEGLTTIKFDLVDAIQYKDYAGAAFSFTYTATVTTDAPMYTGIDNKVKVNYSSNPNNTGDPLKETTETTVSVYTTDLTITKTDGTKSLTGAEFELKGSKVNVGYVTGQKFEEYKANEDPIEGNIWYKLVDGAYTQAKPVDGKDNSQYEDTEKTYKLVEVNDKFHDTVKPMEARAFVDKDGKLVFSGLGVGTYTLTEVTTPDGYNSIKPITFEVTWSEETGFGVKIADNSENKDFQIAVNPDNEGKGLGLSTTIVNLAGSTLPSTGGIGTTIFYVVGGILVAAAVVLLVTKKRMSNRA